MLQSLATNQMTLAGRRTIGFRPPQTYFPFVSVNHIDRLKDRNQGLSNILRRIGLESALYLNIYYGSKLSSHEPDDERLYRDVAKAFMLARAEPIKLGDVLLLLSVYLRWQLIYHPMSLIKTMAKRIFKDG